MLSINKMKMKVNCDKGEVLEVTCSAKLKEKTDLQDFKTVDKFTFCHWVGFFPAKVGSF